MLVDDLGCNLPHLCEAPSQKKQILENCMQPTPGTASQSIEAEFPKTGLRGPLHTSRGKTGSPKTDNTRTNRADPDLTIRTDSTSRSARYAASPSGTQKARREAVGAYRVEGIQIKDFFKARGVHPNHPRGTLPPNLA